jgi:peptide deformylase
MALRQIVVVPHEALGCSAEKVTDINDKIIKLAADMAETMYKAPGIGLAANQVGKLLQLIVIDVVYPYAEPSEKKKNPVILLNPAIVIAEGEATAEEGCLSVPEFGLEVRRATQIKVEAVDISGKPISFEAEGLFARALQHEIDHLHGKTILDHASALKRRIYVGRLRKLARRGEKH